MTQTVDSTSPGKEVVRRLDLRLFDGDTHYYEPLDALTRHLDSASARRMYRYVRTEDGGTRLLVNGRALRMVSDPTFDPLALPGSLLKAFKEGGDATYSTAFSSREPLSIHPEFTDRDARLLCMDECLVDKAFVLPTLGVCIEEYLTDEPEMTSKALTAFNMWLEDDWGYSYRDRLFGVPLISLIDPVSAETELARVLSLGARIVHLRPCPVPGAWRGRSLADRAFDRFWALADEAGVVIAFHLADTGQHHRFSADWGEEGNPPPTAVSRFHLMSSYRPAYDTLGDLLLHGLFDRFPRLRVLFVELGAEWVGFFLKNLAKNLRRADRANLVTRLDPIESFRKHIYVSPYPEEDLRRVLGSINEDRVVFGSDFPHVEGVALPTDFFDPIADLDPVVLQKIGVGNANSLLGPPGSS